MCNVWGVKQWGVLKSKMFRTTGLEQGIRHLLSDLNSVCVKKVWKYEFKIEFMFHCSSLNLNPMYIALCINNDYITDFEMYTS